jgi:hypothetical protein
MTMAMTLAKIGCSMKNFEMMPPLLCAHPAASEVVALAGVLHHGYETSGWIVHAAKLLVRCWSALT